MPFDPDKFLESGTSSAGASPSEEQADQAAQANTAEQNQYGTPGQQAIAGLEAAGRGVAGPLATAVETADPDTLSPILNRLGPVGRIAGIAKQMLGKVNPKDIRGREEANPITSAAGTVAGLLTPGGQGELLSEAGSKLVSGIADKGVLRGMTKGAIKLAAENAMFQGGDETTKLLLNDPNQSVGSAIANIGLAGAIGAVAGGAIGSVNPLWKATIGDKASEFISDFKARMREHLDLPAEEPTSSIVTSKPEELSPTNISRPIEVFKTRTSASEVPEVNLNTVPEQHTDFFNSLKPKAQPEVVETIPKEVKLLDQTPGGKLADKLVRNSDDILSKTAAGGVGGAIGHLSGIPYGGTIGAILGERVLGPLFKSVIPAIGKKLLDSDVSADSLKAAADYGASVVKGQKLSDVASKNIFVSNASVIPDSKRPTLETRKKLDAALSTYQQDPSKLASIGQNIGHYLPNHAVAIGGITANAVNFLNSIKPQSATKAPLDPPLKPSQAVQSQYDRVLDIAQQPLIVLDAIKQGTLTSHDVMALHTLYPDLYASLRTKVMSQLVETVAKQESIPYQSRLGLSMFLQQPLDSTMKPIGIASAQPMPQQPQNGSSTGANEPNGPKKVSQAASSNLIKGAKSSQTASQASEAMHSSGKA